MSIGSQTLRRYEYLKDRVRDLQFELEDIDEEMEEFDNPDADDEELYYHLRDKHEQLEYELDDTYEELKKLEAELDMADTVFENRLYEMTPRTKQRIALLQKHLEDLELDMKALENANSPQATSEKSRLLKRYWHYHDELVELDPGAVYDPFIYDMDEAISDAELDALVTEIIKKCNKSDKQPGKPWCLYTKHSPHRVLGHHKTEKSAEDQEAAIHSHGG